MNDATIVTVAITLVIAISVTVLIGIPMHNNLEEQADERNLDTFSPREGVTCFTWTEKGELSQTRSGCIRNESSTVNGSG